jgi:hypothetical protein
MWLGMTWDVEFEDEFREWWSRLTEDEQESVDFTVQLLALHGPSLGSAFEPKAGQSGHAPTRELRAHHHGRWYRVFYTCEPGRSTIVLLGAETVDGWRCRARVPGESAAVQDAHSR